MLDYTTLRVIWWAILGTLLIGFAIMDGFDFGVAGLLRVLGRDNEERKVLLEGIEPTWEGNQVWFIVAGGATFAAWPMLYAVSFSGMYMAIALVLLALILRPVGFKFRERPALGCAVGLGAGRLRAGGHAGVRRGLRQSVSWPAVPV